jgi:hypothetical protein
VSANDEQVDLSYVSELRIGVLAASLAVVLLAMACTLATGLYWPTHEDKLWALLSRKALPEHAEPLDDSTVLSLQRASLSCFGCPDYSVRIFGSGKVEYAGDQYVCVFGVHEAAADTREVRRLVEAMLASGYSGFAWKKGPYRMDAPNATSILRHHGRSYHIDHYLGDPGAPRWLGAMEQEIDRVAGSARWLPDPSTFRCTDPAVGTRMVTRSAEPIEN